MQSLAERRRGSRALTCGLRSVLSRGAASGPRAPSAFLRDLRRFDKGLEAIWVPDRWVLYRRTRRGPTPSEDALVKELEVTGPNGEYRDLGPWVIDWLRRLDKTEGGSVDPEYASRQFMNRLEEDKKEKARAEKKEIEEAHQAARIDLDRYAIYDRKHFPQGQSHTKTRQRRTHARGRV